MRAVPAGMTIPMRTALAATITVMNTSTIILTTAALAAMTTVMNTSMIIPMRVVPAAMTTVMNTSMIIPMRVVPAATIMAMNTNMNILTRTALADMTTVILTAILTDIAADADMITETAVAAVTITA